MKIAVYKIVIVKKYAYGRLQLDVMWLIKDLILIEWF